MTTTPTTPMASDADISAWHRWIDDEPDDVIGTHVSAGEIRKVLNRLAASEARNADLERENEWRGLLIQAVERGVLVSRYNSVGGHGWLISYHSFPQIDIPDNNGLPARPDDATVAKIKEAVNG